MDVHEKYKLAVAESQALIAKEKELEKKVKDMKQLKEQTAARKARIAELEAELRGLIE